MAKKLQKSVKLPPALKSRAIKLHDDFIKIKKKQAELATKALAYASIEVETKESREFSLTLCEFQVEMKRLLFDKVLFWCDFEMRHPEYVDVKKHISDDNRSVEID